MPAKAKKPTPKHPLAKPAKRSSAAKKATPKLSAAKTRDIRQKVRFTATPEMVFTALTSVEQHSEFTQAKATGAPKKGGAYTAHDGYIQGRYLELSKPDRLVSEWSTRDWPEGQAPSTLTFTFKESKGGCELSMVHAKLPAAQAKGYAEGWKKYYWDPLQAFFSRC